MSTKDFEVNPREKIDLFGKQTLEFPKVKSIREELFLSNFAFRNIAFGVNILCNSVVISFIPNIILSSSRSANSFLYSYSLKEGRRLKCWNLNTNKMYL